MLASPCEVESQNFTKNQHVRLFATPGTLQSDEPSFWLSQVGNSLNLNFQPIAEPSTFVLWGIGIITVLGYSLRRRNRTA